MIFPLKTRLLPSLHSCCTSISLLLSAPKMITVRCIRCEPTARRHGTFGRSKETIESTRDPLDGNVVKSGACHRGADPLDRACRERRLRLAHHHAQARRGKQDAVVELL